MITFNKLKNSVQFAVLCMLICGTVISCSKNSESNVSGKATVKFNFSGIKFDTKNIQANLKANFGYQNDVPKNRQTTIQLAPDLWVEMQLQDNYEVNDKRSASTVARSVNMVEELPDGRDYRLVVYDASGEYVTHVDYTYLRGVAPTEELFLDGGKTYTFVAYMLRDDPEDGDDIVGVSLADAKIGLSIWNTPYQDEFAWWKETRLIQGGQTTHLNITLTYISSTFTIVHDATAINDVITEVFACGLYDMYTDAEVSLLDGQLHYTNINTNAGVNGDQPTNYPNAIVSFSPRSIFSNTAYYRAVIRLASNPSEDLYLRTPVFNILPGTRYTLYMKYTRKPGDPIVIPIPNFPIEIASANLEGTSTVKTLAENQAAIGSTYLGNGSQGYCAGALGAGWYMPDADDITFLLNEGGSVRGEYKDQLGWFFGTSDLAQATAYPNRYLFLPDNSSSILRHNQNPVPANAAGAYWVDEITQGSNKNALIFPAPNAPSDSKPYIMAIHQNNALGIRCVRTI